MKRIYLLALIGLMTLNLIGQKTNPLFQVKNENIAFQEKAKPGLKGKRMANKRGGQNAQREIKQALDYILTESFIGDEWYNEDKSLFTYDINGNNTLQINQLWENDWVDTDKSEQSFDSNGNMLESTYIDWDDTNNSWVPIFRENYTYDESGRLSVIIEEYWDAGGNKWHTSFKTEFVYDGDNRLTEELIYTWDQGNESWNISWKDTYSYDGNGNMILTSSYSWNGEWEALWKTDLTYDSDKNVVMELNSIWESSENSWEQSWKDEYTYDENGNMTFFMSYEWEGAWEASWKSEVGYDNSHPIDELVLPWWWFDDDYITYRHMPVSGKGYEFNAASNEWDIEFRSTLNYSELDVTGINNPEGNSIKVYPNPATDYISFDLEDRANEATVELYDLQGRLVLKQMISAKSKIKVGYLDQGLYMYKLLQNDNSFSGKVIIE